MIVNFTDFMWNMNPVEEDVVTFVIDQSTGTPDRIVYQPMRNFPDRNQTDGVPDSTPIANANFQDVFVDIDFDGRQVLELDAPEGMNSIKFTYFFDASDGAVESFVATPTFVADDARTITDIDNAGTDMAADDDPAVRMIESDPNTSYFEAIDEANGSRSNIFTAANDKVASWDYFDIIASVPMTSHDGFTSVDAEIYDSADRAILTITDPDQNLRSRVSETKDARSGKNFIKIGDPIPIINTRELSSGIFDTNLSNVKRIYEAAFIVAGADDGTEIPGIGTNGIVVRADVDHTGQGGFQTIDDETGAGTEAFVAHEDDIDLLNLNTLTNGTGGVGGNDRAAIILTATGLNDTDIDGDGDFDDLASGLVIDTRLSLDDINDVAVNKTMTVKKLLEQVNLDGAEDGASDADASYQSENWLVENARIKQTSDGKVIGRPGTTALAALANSTSVQVEIPKYNLIQLDVSQVGFTLTPSDFVVQIEVVRNACRASDDGDTAFAVDGTKTRVSSAGDCVVARQVVDFTPFVEIGTATNDDTDGDKATGDMFSTAAFGRLDGAFSATSGSAVDEDETGYSREATTKKSAIGAFRVFDLDDAAEVAAGAPSDSATFLRFEIIFIGDRDPSTGDAQTDEPQETLKRQTQVLALDILGLSILFDPSPTLQEGSPGDVKMDADGTFSNMIYRTEVDEASSDSAIFTASADFMTATQFDTIADVLGFIVPSGDPVKMWLPNRFIPPNRLAFTYVDEDIVNFFRSVSATFIYETRDGKIEWDKSSYSFGQDAFITLTDEDLNRRPDATERYSLPIDGFVYFEIDDRPVTRLTVDKDGNPSGFTVDATLLETGSDTGTFVAQITMGNKVTSVPAGGGTAATTNTQQADFEVNYVDIRDVSSITFATFSDIANIRTTLGDVVLDRAAYPPGALMFVEIHDNDYNIDVDIRETIDLRKIVITGAISSTTTTGSGWRIGTTAVTEGTVFDGTTGSADLTARTSCDTLFEFVTSTCSNAAPILEVTIFRSTSDGGGKLATLLPAGFLGLPKNATTGKSVPEGLSSTSAGVARFGVGVETAETGTPDRNVLPMVSRAGAAITKAEETGPNTGIFEFEVRLPGPAEDTDNFPFDLPDVLTAGTVDTPTIKANQPIQVTYTDNADESGEAEDEEELATILFNTARLRTDKTEYGLGESVRVIVEEPDFNFNSRVIDEVDDTILDLITDKVDTEADETSLQQALSDKKVSTDLPKLRETDFNTGVFSYVIEDLPKTLIDRGEDGELIYTDKSPSGGGASIRIEYEFLVVEILPEIIFDKEEYTPFDEFTVSIISPDSNLNPDRIDTITVLISSSSSTLGRVELPETGPNTGIFEEDFDLTPNTTTFAGRDLLAIREDGVTVEFRIDEDTVATKSVFVNYHVGQIMFDKDAFQINERGVLRAIDPDANQNPDTIDTLEVRFWSTTDRGGLKVVLRETGDRTGIFEEIISFTPDEESTGTRLRVTEADTITAKLQDDTLPAPAALASDKIKTVEIEELFASALIGALIPPLQRAVASEPDLVDQSGQAVSEVSVGSQVLIQSEITNSQTKKQPFAYIVKINDENGATISLSWVTGELPAKDSLTAAQSWIPDVAGDYTVEIFVWESVEKPVALSPVRSTTVSVS